MDKITLDSLILKLFEIKAVKFGTFTLKSGISSPVYFDLRVIVSFPALMRDVAEYMWQMIQEKGCQYKSVCGVPYTALPIASVLCALHDKPMLMRRKEAKDYGTKKMLEGLYEEGETCLILEDVVTSGSSVMETVQVLADHKVKVTDAIVLLNREQGGQDMLQHNGITLHSVCTMTQLVDILVKANKIDASTAEQVAAFVRENNTYTANGQPTASVKPKAISYEARSSLCEHSISKRLFHIMAEKRTNLALSADVTTGQQLIKLVDDVGPYVCVVKTHIDILDDFTPKLLEDLQQLASKHNFLIFEDRKFADIGNTVQHQYQGGVYKIADWADIINAHTLPGDGIVAGLKQVGQPKARGCLLLAEMSSKDNLFTKDYTTATVAMAEKNTDFVIGFICRSKLTENPKLVHMTPGVQLAAGSDALGQQYLTPSHVIGDLRSDVIIVGRGITQAENPAAAAQQYQQAGYEAYQRLLE